MNFRYSSIVEYIVPATRNLILSISYLILVLEFLYAVFMFLFGLFKKLQGCGKLFVRKSKVAHFICWRVQGLLTLV